MTQTLSKIEVKRKELIFGEDEREMNDGRFWICMLGIFLKKFDKINLKEIRYNFYYRSYNLFY